jgi:hypothetical protein
MVSRRRSRQSLARPVILLRSKLTRPPPPGFWPLCFPRVNPWCHSIVYFEREMPRMNEGEPFSMRLDHGIIPEVSRNNPGLLQAEELVDFSDDKIRDSDKVNNRHQPRPKIAVCRFT